MMGWDLYSRRNNCYFRVTQYAWYRLEMALEFLGADISRMSEYNDGSYVPARVAESWAKAIENGVDTLKLAIVKDRYCENGEGYFIIPMRYDEKMVRKLVREYYGKPKDKKSTVEFDRIEPLPTEFRGFLLQFAKFCRRSRGFEQW